MKRLLLYTLLLIGISISSCKTKQKQPFGRNTILENRQWNLLELNGAKYTAPKRGDRKAGIRFEAADNTYSATVGCNLLNGMYTTQDEMIKIHAMQSTKMGCPPEMKEEEFFKALENTTRFSLAKKKVNKKDFYTLELFSEQSKLAKLEMDTTGVW